MNRTAIFRWTGKGNKSYLQSSIEFKLRSKGTRAKTWATGNSVIVEGPEPVGVAAMLGLMPGVAWVAAGFAADSFGEMSVASGALAKKYLRRRDRFYVEAEGTSGVVPSDVAGVVTSGILESVKGTMVSLAAPKFRFRAAFDGTRGVVGVELRRGPGGVPTGRETAACLVSGGVHSSVLAWMAVLMGFRVRLVHAKSSEEGLRAAARLYSELSHRADPRGLGLEVLQGDQQSKALAAFSAESRDPVFAGFYSTGRPVPENLRRKVQAPLYLMPDETFQSEFESLGVKEHDSLMDWKAAGSGTFRVKSFGGIAADVSEVLDGLS